jgi:hypothetical protein
VGEEGVGSMENDYNDKVIPLFRIASPSSAVRSWKEEFLA